MNCPSCNQPIEEDARFCGVCSENLELFWSEFDQPESIVQYREALTDFLSDRVLEDWEKEALSEMRGTLKVTVAAHERLVEEMGGTTQAPAPIAILLDTAQIKKFHVGGSCVFSFQFQNQSDKALRSVSLTFRDSELAEPMTVKTKSIGPDLVTQGQLVEKLHEPGGHVLSGDVTVVSLMGESDQFELDPVTYDVGRDSSNPTQINIDQSSLRVADMGNAQIGGSTGTQSGVVSDRSWLPLKLIRVSTAIRAEEEKRRQEAEEARRAEEDRKRQEAEEERQRHEAEEKARKEAEEERKAEVERKRQEAEAVEKARKEVEVDRQRHEAEEEEQNEETYWSIMKKPSWWLMMVIAVLLSLFGLGYIF